MVIRYVPDAGDLVWLTSTRVWAIPRSPSSHMSHIFQTLEHTPKLDGAFGGRRLR